MHTSYLNTETGPNTQTLNIGGSICAATPEKAGKKGRKRKFALFSAPKAGRMAGVRSWPECCCAKHFETNNLIP